MINRIHIALYKLHDSMRECDDTLGFGCFGVTDDILLFQTGIAMVNFDRIVFKVKIHRTKSENFTPAKSAPIEKLECGLRAKVF